MGGSRIRNVRAIKKAANIIVISRMETVMESLSRASLAVTLTSNYYLFIISNIR